MIGVVCGVPECEHHATAEWDTVRGCAADAHTYVPIPVCDFHFWMLNNGAQLTLKFRG